MFAAGALATLLVIDALPRSFDASDGQGKQDKHGILLTLLSVKGWGRGVNS